MVADTSHLPSSYIRFLRELATLSDEPRVTCQPLEIGLPPELFHSPQGNPDIDLGCSNIEQDFYTGEATLWHSVFYGPYGDPTNPEFEEDTESFGGWPYEGNDDEHFLSHGIDKFSWALLQTLDQVLNGFLDSEHERDCCTGLDVEFCNELRKVVIRRLEPLISLDCVCASFARQEITELQTQLESLS